MKAIDLNTWNRKQHFEHFIKLFDPTFSMTLSFDVSACYERSKQTNISFFVSYLHNCMKALNGVDNFRLRIKDKKPVMYDVIHASATIMRSDKTFGFSFIHFDNEIDVFYNNFLLEKERIENSHDLFPPQNSLDCIHCSANPWFSFSAHKEPITGELDSVPKFSFGKAYKKGDSLMMNVGITMNHALIDGYHLGEFSTRFQKFLNGN